MNRVSDDLVECTALVPASTRNIRKVVTLLAQQGADVAIRSYGDLAPAGAAADQLRACGVKTTAVVGDLVDEAGVKRMVAGITDALGPIDILADNVSVRPQRACLDVQAADWDAVLKTNLDRAFVAE